MPWVLHMRMRANALRCRFLGYLQLDLHLHLEITG